MRAVMLLGLLLVACRTYEPKLMRSYHVTAKGEASDGDVESSALNAGESFRVERYQVEGFQCMRAAGTDPRGLPDAAVTPGASAIFDIIYPAEQTAESALVFMPHGNSFEFIEDIFTHAIVKLGVSEDVRPYYALLGGNPEQTTIAGTEYLIGETVKLPIAMAMTRKGATVVVPGNCWGDGSSGQGEVRRAFMLGERLGGAFDRRTWDYAKSKMKHAKDRELAVACSGGGRRTIEMMHRDDQAFSAVVLDSPADDLTAFLQEPRGDLIALAGSLALSDADLEAVFERFWKGMYGSKEQAFKRSISDEIAEGKVKIPVYLAYGIHDPVVTLPMTARLVAAMSAADASQFAVKSYEQGIHCQLVDEAAIDPVLAWLGEKVGL